MIAYYDWVDFSVYNIGNDSVVIQNSQFMKMILGRKENSLVVWSTMLWLVTC